MVRHLLTGTAIAHVNMAGRKGIVVPIGVFYERHGKKRGGSKAKVAAAGMMLKIAYRS